MVLKFQNKTQQITAPRPTACAINKNKKTEQLFLPSEKKKAIATSESGVIYPTEPRTLILTS
jgi:hypothetical protein